MNENAGEDAYVYRKNDAPDLPHYGKAFVYHGPSGVITLRIDLQSHIDDDLVHVGGVILHGIETFETGYVRDCKGIFTTVFVTRANYMRLSNAPLPAG